MRRNTLRPVAATDCSSLQIAPKVVCEGSCKVQEKYRGLSADVIEIPKENRKAASNNTEHQERPLIPHKSFGSGFNKAAGSCARTRSRYKHAAAAGARA
jgi:hypothetical protein